MKKLNEMDNRTMSPLVSVIIPTLNREKYLRQCIESVLSQDYPNFEVIVVDNGSTDNTPQILASFGNKIRCLKEGKKGVSAARNKGLRSAGGEFIALLDSDDFYLLGKLSLSVKKLREDHFVSLVYTDYIKVDSEGRQTKTTRKNHPSSEEFLRTFLKGFGIFPSTTLLRKECLEKTGYFDETLQYAEDTDMWLRMLKADYRFGHISEPLTAYRVHPGNYSRLKDDTNWFLQRLHWDKIWSSAIGDFTLQELFGDLLKNKDYERIVKMEYDKIGYACCLKYLPLSACVAAKKSLEVGHFRALFSLSFLVNAWQIPSVLYSILETAVKLFLSNINHKFTRKSTSWYRWKLNALFFNLKYILSLLFRYELNNRD